MFKYQEITLWYLCIWLVFVWYLCDIWVVFVYVGLVVFGGYLDGSWVVFGLSLGIWV